MPPYTEKQHEIFKQQWLQMVTSRAADEFAQLCLAEIRENPIRDEYVDVSEKRWYIFLTGEIRDGEERAGPWLFAYMIQPPRTILLLTICAASSAVDARGRFDREAATRLITRTLDRPGQSGI
jgi:hypothetical protein